MTSRVRPALLAAALGVFLGSVVAAALISDVVSQDPVFLLPDPAEAIAVAKVDDSVPPAVTADESGSDPGAMVAPVLVPSAPPLLPDEPTTQPALEDDPTAPGAAVTIESPPPEVDADPPAWGSLAMILAQPFEAIALEYDTVFRFFDLCADTDQVSGCPGGLGATVLFAGGSAPPPPVAIELLPDPPQPIRDQVRCDLAWPSSNEIPLLIVSNRPLDLYHARLALPDGREISSVVNQRSTPSEIAWYEGRVQSGAHVGTAVGNGVHSCVVFRLDGPQAPDGMDRTGRFEVTVNAFAGESSKTITMPFAGSYSANTPPVRIHPLDGYRAMVVVPQRYDQIVDTTLSQSWQFVGRPGVGECRDPGGFVSGTATRRNPVSGPTAYSEASLAAADYPWDRAYTHYTVWDLYLTSGTDYVFCVEWSGDDGVTHDHFVVQTPNLWDFQLYGTRLGYNSRVDAGSMSLHVPGIEGCWVANPGQGSAGGRDPFPELTLSNPGGWGEWWLPDPYLCLSHGWRYPDVIEVWAGLSAPGDNTVYGVVRLPISVLMHDCRADRASPVQSSTDGCDGPTLEWRSQKVLCGGPIGVGDCKGTLFRTLGLHTVMVGDSRWDRTGPGDWIISHTVELAEPSDTVPLEDLEPAP